MADEQQHRATDRYLRPRVRPEPEPDPVDEAAETSAIWGTLIAGALALIAGAVITALAWPDEGSVSNDDRAMVILGLAIGAVGSLMVSGAVIALAVVAGLRAYGAARE